MQKYSAGTRAGRGKAWCPEGGLGCGARGWRRPVDRSAESQSLARSRVPPATATRAMKPARSVGRI